MADKIHISLKDLQTPDVDEYLETQAQLRLSAEPVEDVPWFLRLIYSSWFYLAIWSAVGAFVGWIVLEPFFSDTNEEFEIGALLMFPSVAGCIGLFLGMSEGVMCRNPQRALWNGAIGFLVGFFGTLVLQVPLGIVFALVQILTLGENFGPDDRPGVGQLVGMMMGRSIVWAIISVCAGLGQGLAQYDRKVIFNGILGGVLGGLLGGLLFDPISLVLLSDGEAVASRGVGFVVIGFSVGLFVGLVEGWTKTAWLLMRKGPLAGKQFILHRDATVLGSSPKAGIYLFKDMDIEPRHAVLYNHGGRFELEDCQTSAGTFVNGERVQGRRYLQSGDQIELGKTVLEFALRAAETRG
jgi:hypothetical protein